MIGTFEGDVDFAVYRDDYQEGLREIIDAKIEGREIVAQEVRGAAEGGEPDGRAAEAAWIRSAGRRRSRHAIELVSASGDACGSRRTRRTEQFDSPATHRHEDVKGSSENHEPFA